MCSNSNNKNVVAIQLNSVESSSQLHSTEINISEAQLIHSKTCYLAGIMVTGRLDKTYVNVG